LLLGRHPRQPSRRRQGGKLVQGHGGHGGQTAEEGQHHRAGQLAMRVHAQRCGQALRQLARQRTGGPGLLQGELAQGVIGLERRDEDVAQADNAHRGESQQAHRLGNAADRSGQAVQGRIDGLEHAGRQQRFGGDQVGQLACARLIDEIA